MIKPVLRIGGEGNNFDRIIVAGSGSAIWDIEETLERYQINELMIVLKET